jgi:opacity protein-like surface antigen
MKKLLVGAFLAMLVGVSPAHAQIDDKLVHVNIGGGFTVPMSDIGDRFGTGGGFNIGISIDPSPAAGFQVEYGFNDLAGEERSIELRPTPVATSGSGVLNSHHSMHYLDFNGIVRSHGSAVNVYGIGGMGMYYRTVSLTTPDVGYTTVCDPYWYVCYPGFVEIDRIVGDRSSWDPGVDFGGGLTIGLGESAQFYVETRWHYIWGNDFTALDGTTQSTNAQYFPVTFGFRF